MLPGWELFVGAVLICAGLIGGVSWLDKKYQEPKIDPDMVRHIREKGEHDDPAN